MMFSLQILLSLVGVATATVNKCTDDDLTALNEAYESQPLTNCTTYGSAVCVNSECFEYRERMADLTPDCWFADRNLYDVALGFTSIPACDGSISTSEASIGSGGVGSLTDCSDPSEVDQVNDGLDQFQATLTENEECK